MVPAVSVTRRALTKRNELANNTLAPLEIKPTTNYFVCIKHSPSTTEGTRLIWLENNGPVHFPLQAEFDTADTDLATDVKAPRQMHGSQLWQAIQSQRAFVSTS